MLIECSATPCSRYPASSCPGRLSCLPYRLAACRWRGCLKRAVPLAHARKTVDLADATETSNQYHPGHHHPLHPIWHQTRRTFAGMRSCSSCDCFVAVGGGQRRHCVTARPLLPRPDHLAAVGASCLRWRARPHLPVHRHCHHNCHHHLLSATSFL